MARQRMLKPEFFTDAKVTRLQPLDRIFFAGLWCYADRVGVLLDDPADLALRILPRETDFDADASLQRMAEMGLISRYRHGAVSYIHVRNFMRHQRPHKNEAKSQLHLPCEGCLHKVPDSLIGCASSGNLPSSTAMSAGVGVGVGVGVVRPPAAGLSLVKPPDPTRPPKAKSRQISFYRWASERRAAEFPDDPDAVWTDGRVNTTLGFLRGLEDELASHAYDEFLEDEHKRSLDPPCPMWAFCQDWPIYVKRAEPLVKRG